MQIRFIVGVDEAGRGPLAGPVAVGLVKVAADFDWDLVPGVGDSKKVTAKNRATIFERAKQLRREGLLDFVVLLGTAKQIDDKGIAVVIKDSIGKGLQKLQLNPEVCFVKLDGSLKAPQEYSQETIVKGDAKELVIGLASICAKETRDEYMRKISTRLPEYDFATHKGYGTKQHRTAVIRHGLSKEHRQTYCQNQHLWSKL